MTSRITAYRKLLFVRDSNKARESPHLRAAQGKGTTYCNIVLSSPSRVLTVIRGSLRIGFVRNGLVASERSTAACRQAEW